MTFSTFAARLNETFTATLGPAGTIFQYEAIFN